MPAETSQRRGWIFDKAAELEQQLEQARDEAEQARAEIGVEQDKARLWRERTRDLRAVLNGIVTDPTSDRRDVQSKCLLALERSEGWG